MNSNSTRLAACLLLSALVALFLSCLPAFAEDAGLSDEEKSERRLQFNAYVESEIAKARRKAAGPEAKPIYIHGGGAFGYDTNPTLDSSHDNDSFYETTADVGWRQAHTGAGFLGAGNAGLEARIRYINYEDYPTLDYQDYSFGGFADAALAPRWKAKLDYDLGFVRYIENKPLNYRSHRIKPAIVFSPVPGVQHSGYGIAEWKDYDDRKALSDFNTPTNDDRRDLYTEVGWSMRGSALKDFVYGITAGRKMNDSNDIFNDFNDYKGWKLNGFLYRAPIGKFSWIAFAGYDHKEYDARRFLTTSDITQEDDFYYAGANLYYQWDKNMQIVLSYSYRQNESNDPVQGYSGSTFSAGFSWSL